MVFAKGWVVGEYFKPRALRIYRLFETVVSCGLLSGGLVNTSDFKLCDFETVVSGG